jgi:chromosome segregation ATPase
VIRRLVRKLGFVTLGELLVTQEKLRQVRQQLDTATDRVARAAAAREQLKRARREEEQRHKDKLAEMASEHERRRSRIREAAADASKRIAALEEQLRKRDLQAEATAREAATVDAGVVAAVQDLDLARQHLMAIEVKLDILEGAANVLDTRVRVARGLVADAPR